MPKEVSNCGTKGRRKHFPTTTEIHIDTVLTNSNIHYAVLHHSFKADAHYFVSGVSKQVPLLNHSSKSQQNSAHLNYAGGQPMPVYFVFPAFFCGFYFSPRLFHLQQAYFASLAYWMCHVAWCICTDQYHLLVHLLIFVFHRNFLHHLLNSCRKKSCKVHFQSVPILQKAENVRECKMSENTHAPFYFKLSENYFYKLL